MIKKLTAISSAILVTLGAQANDKTSTFLVGFPPGGGNYNVTKIVSDSASELGFKNTIEFKVGAGGIIGMNECVKRVIDPNVLCMASQAQYVYSTAISPEIRKFDPEKLTYVKLIAGSPNVIVTSAKNAKTIEEVLADLRNRNIEQITFASGATGTKVVTNWFGVQTGSSNLQIIDYKGNGPAMIDIAGEHVKYGILPYTVVKPQVDGGLLRIVSIVGNDFDDVELKKYPKIQKYVSGMDEDTTYFGFVMGPDADKTAVDEYNRVLTKILSQESVRVQFARQGIFPVNPSVTPDQFRQMAANERARLEKQIKAMPAWPLKD